MALLDKKLISTDVEMFQMDSLKACNKDLYVNYTQNLPNDENNIS